MITKMTMRNTILTIAMIALTIGMNAQTFVGLGVSTINKQPSLSLDFAFDGYYMGFSSNYATGDGTELNYSSDSTYATDISNVSVLNFGYFIPLSKTISIAPILGYGSTSTIFQDPVGFNTYFYGATEVAVNLGVKATYIVDDSVGVMIGIGTFENLQASLVVKL